MFCTGLNKALRLQPPGTGAREYLCRNGIQFTSIHLRFADECVPQVTVQFFLYLPNRDACHHATCLVIMRHVHYPHMCRGDATAQIPNPAQTSARAGCFLPDPPLLGITTPPGSRPADLHSFACLFSKARPKGTAYVVLAACLPGTLIPSVHFTTALPHSLSQTDWEGPLSRKFLQIYLTELDLFQLYLWNTWG